MTADETPPPEPVRELERRQDEVLLELDDLIGRLDAVLAEYAQVVAADSHKRLAA